MLKGIIWLTLLLVRSLIPGHSSGWASLMELKSPPDPMGQPERLKCRSLLPFKISFLWQLPEEVRTIQKLDPPELRILFKFSFDFIFLNV